MSPTGLFYAYAIHRTNACYNYLITFPSAKVADSWWRAITDSVESGHTKYASIQRLSPQFYIYGEINNISQTVGDDRCAIEFYGKLHFTCLYNWNEAKYSHLIVPIIEYPDHRNGSSYYIRSTEDRRKYWNTQGGYIVPSTSHRSLFTVRISDSRKAADAVILEDDEIHISCVEDKQTKAISVTSDGNYALQTGEEFSTFKFGDLTNGTISERDIRSSYYSNAFMIVLSTHDDNPWSEWELILKN